MNRKIPAFTLMEVTITMLISAIAIAITYTAAHIISTTYGDYQKKQNEVATFTVLDQLLRKDFGLSGRIIKSDEGMMIELPEGTLTYTFQDGSILRNQFALQTDTFKVGAREVNFSFEKHAVNTAEPIDQLALHITLEGADVPLVYKKTYSAQELFH